MDNSRMKINDYFQVGNYNLEDVDMVPQRLSNEINVPSLSPTNPLLYIIENNIEQELCEEIITRFNNDIRKQKGRIFKNKINIKVKNTLDLGISRLPDWNDIDRKLFNTLLNNIKKYENVLNLHNVVLPETLIGQGFQIQKYNKGIGEYKWHTDNLITHLELPDGSKRHMSRFLTFMWYLNDIEDGGETIFLDGKVKPKTGQFLFFPATWDQLHRASLPISDNKYIITGWLYENIIS